MSDQYQLKNIYESLLKVIETLITWEVIEDNDRADIIKYYNQCPDDKKEKYVESVFELGKEKSVENYEIIRHLDYYFDTKELLDKLPDEKTPEEYQQELDQLEKEKQELLNQNNQIDRHLEEMEKQERNDKLLSKLPSSSDRRALTLDELLDPNSPRPLNSVPSTTFENSSSLAGNSVNNFQASTNVPIFTLDQRNTAAQTSSNPTPQQLFPTRVPNTQSANTPFQPVNIPNPAQYINLSNNTSLPRPWNPNAGVVRPEAQSQTNQNNH